MDMLHMCLDENGLLQKSVLCAPMNELMNENQLFREIIIPKLKNVFRAKHDKDIIMKLICNLSTKDAIISERLLHVIVTSSIDLAELEPSNYKKHIKTVKSAIEVLEYFVKVLVDKKENNKTETDSKSEFEDDDTDDFIEENYTEKMVELLSNLTYSTNHQEMTNVFIAYKWLAELYGVLCDNSNHLTKYQKRLNKYILLAEKINGNDDHLKYLKNKQDAKILLANNSWEVNSWLGGWYFSNLKTETSKILDTSEKGEKSKILYVMDSVKNDYEQMYRYLNCAINEIVITSEDRTRNMEAHELFSMYLMIANRHEIEKHTVKTMPNDEILKGEDNTNINNEVVNKIPSDEVKINTASGIGWFRTYISG
ncbi:unnamed protein product [Macrosiphum euphorbiae]|uniref:Uncharacterized protein n=1 Tax=Macrosiphum euphorbiae TaxID=13131 RepID=A0AAV0WUR7_9HEMI|nr:unnamed protein product [Macrosiphum euphorbiae]